MTAIEIARECEQKAILLQAEAKLLLDLAAVLRGKS